MGMGPANSLHASAYYSKYHEGFDLILITHKNLIIKVLDSIPHPLNLNLFGELLTLALVEN